MALTDQIEALKTALAAQDAALAREMEEVKAKFDAFKEEVNNLKSTVADLTAKLAAVESIDLTAEIAAVNDSVAKIDAISNADAEPNPVDSAPVAEPAPEPAAEVAPEPVQ